MGFSQMGVDLNLGLVYRRPSGNPKCCHAVVAKEVRASERQSGVLLTSAFMAPIYVHIYIYIYIPNAH